MSLQKLVVEVPPLGGLNQADGRFAGNPVDPRGGNPVSTQFHRLRNVFYTKTGALQKRAGFGALPNGATDGGVFQARAVVSSGRELAALAIRGEAQISAPGDAGPFLWSWSPAAGSWSPRASVTGLVTSRKAAVRGEGRLDSFSPQVARVGTVEASLYVVAGSAHIRIVDRATDAVLLDDILLTSTGTAGKYVLFVCGGLFTVVWVVGGTQLRRGTIHPTTLAVSAANVGGASVFAVWDAIPTAAGKWAVAHVDSPSPGGNVVVWRVDNTTAALDATTAEFGLGGSHVSLGYRLGSNFLLLAWDDRTDLLAKHYVETTLVTALSSWVVAPMSTWVLVHGVTCNFDHNSRSYVLINGTNAAGVGSLYFRAFSTLGVALFALRTVWWVAYQTRPFCLWTSLFVPVCSYRTSDLRLGWRFGYALLNLTRRPNDVGVSFPASCEGILAPTDGIGLDAATVGEHAPWVQVSQDNVRAWLPLAVARGNGGEALGAPGTPTWADVAEVHDASAMMLLNEGLWGSATASRLLHLTGALPLQYDGQVATEVAFLEPPQLVPVLVGANPSLTYGSSGLAAATPPARYGYVMCWEWLDAHGQVHRSRLSDPFEVLVDDSLDVAATVAIEVKCTAITRRGAESDGPFQRPRLAVFRTLANGSVYYRCNWSSTDVNSTGAPSLTYVDSESDAALLAAGRGEVYTSGGRLENETPPPARHVQTSGGRVWLTSSEAPEVWPSKEIVAGEAPAWSIAQRIVVDAENEPLVGTAYLDGTLVIFSRMAIYLLDASAGPGDTAAPPWPPPMALAATSGCVASRSIVAFQDGVMYRDRSGIKLLTRGRDILDVGAAVSDLTDENPDVLEALVDAASERVYYLVSGGEAGPLVLVYDYKHTGPDRLGSWSVWTWEEENRPVRMTLWQGSLAQVQFGDVTVEGYGALPGYDQPNGDLPQWVTAEIETPWLRIGALSGYQRVWRAVLEMEKKSAHGLQVEFRVDGDETTAAQTEAWTVTNINDLQGLPRERIVIGLAQQKCQTLKIRLFDTAPAVPVADTPTGFLYNGITLEIGQKRGAEKAQKANVR